MDAYTQRRHLVADSRVGSAHGQDLTGRRVVIVGDILHSRVARSNVRCCAPLGAQVTLVPPRPCFPVGVGSWPCTTSYDFDGVLAGTHGRSTR